MVSHRDRCLAVLFRYVQLRIGCLRSPRLRYAFRSTVAERFPFFPRAAARSDVNSRRFGDGFAKVLVTALELSLAMKLRLLDDSIRLRLSRTVRTEAGWRALEGLTAFAARFGRARRSSP